MKFYRIKQISETEFIPQVREWYEFTYNGIEYSNKQFSLWFSLIFQELYCSVKTLENAEKIIYCYKISLKKQKSKFFKIKYFKI